MSSGLPEFLDLARVTRQPLEQAGRIRIGAMPRLAAALSDSGGEVQVALRAQDDGSGRIVVEGSAEAKLALICQRCLTPMSQQVVASFKLVWVRNDAAAAALQDETAEPLLSEDGRVRLAGLVEDELLLALPIVALHELERCDACADMQAAHIAEPETPAKENPFAVLKQLKQHR